MALPVFDVRRLPQRRAWARVTCQRKDCGGWFIVNAASWYRSSKYASRPCPHCWRPSWIRPQS